ARDDHQRDGAELPGPGPAPACDQLGRPAATRAERPDGGDLAVADAAGRARDHRRDGLQLPGRWPPGRRGSVLGSEGGFAPLPTLVARLTACSSVPPPSIVAPAKPALEQDGAGGAGARSGNDDGRGAAVGSGFENVFLSGRRIGQGGGWGEL